MMFAAGFGTRMRPLTLDRPKPLIKVGGQTLIDRTLDLARATAPEPIVANLHYKARMLEAHLQGTGVTTLIESPDILDTGGGLKNALPWLGSNPIMTTNTDAIWMGANPFETALAAWDPDKMDVLLVCIPLEKCVGRAGTGDFDMSKSGTLERGESYVHGGVQIIKPETLEQIDDSIFSLNRVWNQVAATKRLYGVHYDGQWCGIGTPSGIDLAEAMLKRSADE